MNASFRQKFGKIFLVKTGTFSRTPSMKCGCAIQKAFIGQGRQRAIIQTEEGPALSRHGEVQARFVRTSKNLRRKAAPSASNRDPDCDSRASDGLKAASLRPANPDTLYDQDRGFLVAAPGAAARIPAAHACRSQKKRPVRRLGVKPDGARLYIAIFGGRECEGGERPHR